MVNIENLDIQFDTTTGGAGVTITLDGDCEFDFLTVSSSDKFMTNTSCFDAVGNLTILGIFNASGTGVVNVTDTLNITGTFLGGTTANQNGSLWIGSGGAGGVDAANVPARSGAADGVDSSVSIVRSN